MKSALEKSTGKKLSVEEIASATGADAEDVYHVLNHLAANASDILHTGESTPARETFSLQKSS